MQTLKCLKTQAVVVLGKSLRADYSSINQAWLIRPYHKDWSNEVQLAAPVTRVVNTKQEALEIVLNQPTIIFTNH